MATCITLFSLLYVYQQTEILRFAYAEQRQKVAFQELLDKNSLLRYNIEKNCSLANIGSSVANRSDFQMPDKYQLVRLVPSKEGATFARVSPNRETLLSRVFGLKRSAEARTINP